MLDCIPAGSFMCVENMKSCFFFPKNCKSSDFKWILTCYHQNDQSHVFFGSDLFLICESNLLLHGIAKDQNIEHQPDLISIPCAHVTNRIAIKTTRTPVTNVYLCVAWYNAAVIRARDTPYKKLIAAMSANARDTNL